MQQVVSITPKTRKELAQEYGFCADTIRKMCNNIDLPKRRILTTIEVKKFYDHYGLPEMKIKY